MNTIYLHDIQEKAADNVVAANASNTDLVSSIESFIEQSNDKLLITLDDGYESSKRIIPILEKYGVKCVIFVTTGFIDKQVFPYEISISNFFERNQDFVNLDNKKENISTAELKYSAFSQLHKKLKYENNVNRQKMLASLYHINNKQSRDFETDCFLSWIDIKELAAHPLIEIGSHCRNHVHLPSQSIKTIFNELHKSKVRIEEELSIPVTKVSYPYGGHDLRTMAIARTLGYKQGFITEGAPRIQTQFNKVRNKLTNLEGKRYA